MDKDQLDAILALTPGGRAAIEFARGEPKDYPETGKKGGRYRIGPSGNRMAIRIPVWNRY